MNSGRRFVNTVLSSFALAVGLAGCAGSGTDEAAEVSVADPVQEPMEQRPFLTMTELTAQLGESLSEEQRAELFATLFVPMNLNTTPEEDFQLVPGVGSRLAHEFDEYRPYDSIQQFRREIGKYVDEEEVARLEQYVFVPINLNTASDEEILNIPGVGERLLHEFKEYRPYDSIEQFRREIGKYVDDQEISRLERFVTL
jgi:DNA uptake protein ComE-like DNA-binding protein